MYRNRTQTPSDCLSRRQDEGDSLFGMSSSNGVATAAPGHRACDKFAYTRRHCEQVDGRRPRYHSAVVVAACSTRCAYTARARHAGHVPARYLPCHRRLAD